METATARRILVDFPFKVALRHEALTLPRMFELAEALDFSEVFGATGQSDGKRGDLYIDVLEMTPTSVVLQVTPVRAMGYGEIASQFDELLKGIARRFGKTLKVTSISWMVANLGVASDLRGRLHSVR